MKTFLIILAILGILGFLGYLWVRAKLRRAGAWFRVKGLELAIEELQNKQRANTEPDAKLADLITRVETAHGIAKTALEQGDLARVREVADPVLTELAKILEAKAKEQEAAAKNDVIVIDSTATPSDGDGTKSVLALEAPKDDEKKD